MPALLTTASTVLCPHGGRVILTTANTVVKTADGAVLLQTDVHTVAGCPFAPVTPLPCLTVVWQAGTTQVKINGVPALTQASVGQCIGPSGVQGLAIVASTSPTCTAV